MLDACGRTIDYVRISITDRCNLRCVYCMPESGVSCLKHEDILTFEEIERVVRAMQRLGVRYVRVTGGEPMARLGCLPSPAKPAAPVTAPAAPAAQAAPAAKPATPAVATPAAAQTKKININTATAAELDTLKGIGEARSKKIIEERGKAKFKDFADLVKRGTLPSNVEADIKDKITF